MNKSYAIKCSTEDQARELNRKCWELWYETMDDIGELYQKRYFYISEYPGWKKYLTATSLKSLFPVITYEEAISKGLLGEKLVSLHKQHSKSIVCKSCLGKKQNSVYKNKIYKDDFTGVPKSLWWPNIDMVDCSRCKGTGLEPEYTKTIWPNQHSVDSFHYWIDMAMKEPQHNEVQECNVCTWNNPWCPKCNPKVQESPRDDNLVENLLAEINEWRHYADEDGHMFDYQEAFNNGLDFSIRMIKKHLSSK